MTTQSERPRSNYADPATAPASQGYGMSTEQLAGSGAAAGGGPSTQDLADAQPPASQPATDEAPGTTPLFADGERESINDRWRQIQSAFVDQPRDAVQQADELVAELMQHLARMFADERAQLEAQWSRGTDVSTEDLRLGLQRYREFFQRLLAA